MANIRRTSDGVYNSLKKISEEEGVDFGLDGMSLEDFKKKYFSSPANTENLYNRLTEISGEEGIDFGQGSREEWMSSFDHKTQTGETLQESIRQRAMPTAPNVQQPNQSQQTEGYKPTAEEKASFNRTLSAGKHTIDSSLQHFDRKADNLRQQQGLHVPPRINVGETNNLQEREELNPETGKVEKTYTTTRGNEYTSKFAAEQEQQQIDAEARSERYQREHPKEALLSRIDGQEKQIEEQLGKQEVDWVDADGRIHYKGGRGGDEAVENLKMAQQDLRQARTRIERSQQLEASSDFLGGVGLPFTKDWFNNWKNFGYGIWDTLKDPSLYDFGLSDLQKAGTYARMKRKMESGEELTDQETALALAGMSLARSQEIAEVPHGYTAGVTTMEMAPFMLQMAANPAGGVGKAFAKKAIKQFGKNGIKAVSARIGARVLGNAAEAAALSNTLQAPATIANIMQRYTGDSFEYGEDGKLKIGHYDTDENGNSVFVEGGKGLARSVWEGEASSIIENFTELGFGGNINKFLGKVAASGMGRRMGLGYISDLVGKVGATPFAKNMKRMMEKTHWDGLLEEPLEEEYGIILNSLLTGDNKISDLWDSDTQADIFAGTMWFGGFMAGMNTAAYPIYKRNIKKQLQQADNNGSMAFGDEWEVMKAGIEEMDDKDVADYLYSIKDNEAFSNDQKAALFAYASRLKQNQGANVADMLMRMEGGLSQENVAIRDAYARGEELTEPQDMNDAKNTYEFQRERLSEIADDNYITHFEEDPVGTMLLIYDNEEWTPEEKQTALDFVNAKMTYQGMLDRVNDDIENQIEVSNATIDRRRNPSDQQIHPATLVDGQQVYIIGGDLVMTDDGTAINRQASKLINGDNMILTVNATTGKVEAHSVEDFLTVDEPIDAEQMKEEARQNIIATMSQEADNKIDGILQFVPGEEYTVADDQGAQHSIQVVADQGDGTVAVYMDGNMQPTVMDKQTIQQMADSYNIGRTQQQMAARVEAQAQPASVNEVYDIEDTVTLQDGQGGTIEGQVVTLPNAVDGVYVVQTNNGKALQLTADELNSRIISHNGVDIQRAEQGADLNNAGGEAGSEQTSANEPPASALSRIPVRMDGDKPVTDRKGRPVREWHKASVEDAAAALVETTGGDMLMARDTAKDLIDQANAKLEKIRKQKPKGEDPLEIAESRMEIKRQEQEQQAIIKQWKDVNQHIQQQMEAESQRKIAEREAAKSEEQRQREAEEARIRKEQQDEQDRIDSMRNRIDRLNEESAQLQQRVGMEFQFGKELEEAKKHVEEYTELMKKEMEEKEAKYAAQQKEAQENGGFDLRKADDSEEEEVLARNEENWDDEGPDSDFKNSEGAIDVDTIKQQAQQMNLGDIEVLTSTDGLSEKLSKAKGWFNPKTGKIVIVLPNNKSQQDVFNTLLHEGVAHFGLRKMFGENFDTFLYNIYNNVSPDIKARIDAAMKRNGWGRNEATEEYLARLAERTDFDYAEKMGWWSKVKQFFLDMLALAGFHTELTDNELRYILWRSHDNLTHPNKKPSLFDMARDLDMQLRLGVGIADGLPKRTAQTTAEEVYGIIRKAKADGTYMKAPNGKPSNLNEQQWVQVRTNAFKEWFGDWENDPENASKVVDENGEPKVMYHNTNLEWVNKGAPFWTFFEDSHFGTQGQAEDRMPSAREGVKTYAVFLNIRNPQRRSDADQDYLEEKDMTMSEFWQQSAERAKERGFDGIVYLNEYEDKEHPADSWIAFKPNQVKSATDNIGAFSMEDDDIRFSIRTKEPPKKTGKGYKVFVLKDGQLYPPMVANPNGEGTPVGVWLDADAAPVAGQSKTGRPQVKAGGKGTQGGSGQLAYRPGWHLGTIPYALQFNRKDENGEKTLFPSNFVWAEVEYADDVDYQEEARQEGMNANGKYQHSLAGLKRVPTDGSYKYRTNPDPKTDEWIITGAMRVNKILSREEVDELVRKAGREPQKVQPGAKDMQEAIDELNAEIKAVKEADEMGLLLRDDEAWADDVAQEAYEKAVASEVLEWQEAWQDSMISLKAMQDAIAKETGNVATGAEDAYHFENRMHGRAKNMAERYDWQYYRPMLKAFNDFCKEKGLTHEQGMDYLIAKSGLERNMYYAFRDAMKEKLTQTIKAEREKLEKDYAKHRIEELEYKRLKAELEEQERTGVDDAIQQLHESLAWQRAKEDYEHGDITFDEFLRRRESLIHGVVGDLYDKYVKDFSGLTETFAKEWYDDAQDIRKDAQKAIDPTEKRMLWAAYDKAMKEAYKVAYQVAVDDVFGAEADAIPQRTELWEKINAATKETLKHSYESGLMERKTYQKVGSMFDYYLPLRGWEEDKASDVYTYMGKENVFSPAVKKTWGRTSKSENPLAYIGNIAVSTILSGHRNLMKQHFLNYVMNNPTSLVNISESWYENIGSEDDRPVWVLRTADTAGKSADEIVDIVNDFNEEMRLKQLDGKAIPVTGRLRLDVHATSGQKEEHVVEVQRAGHTYQLYINGNPKAAQALNGSAARAVSRISDTDMGKWLTKLNRAMAEFFTSKNPAFIVSNLSRDLNMAGASVRVNEDKAYNAQFIKNVAKVLSPRVAAGDMGKLGLKGLIGRGRGVTGMMPKLMRKYQDGKLNAGNETERLFKEFMDEGGETGFVNMLSIDSFKEKMQKEIAQMNGSSLLGKNIKEGSIHKAFRVLGETFEFYNRCAEDATRFIVYMTSRQMGKSLEQSIADAKDVTLNFNRKGTGAKGNAEVRDLFIFVNPTIQALANMYRMATNHPLKLGAVTLAFMAGGAMMTFINQWLLNMFGGDDDKDAYWNLPPWVRKNNLVFWVPGTKYFFTIPLAQEFRVFYGVGEMMASSVMSHPHQNTAVEIIESVADLVPINPIGNGGNLVIDFLPTATQPILQIAFNTDFTGKPIWKENQGNKYAPMYEKAYASTPRWMTKVADGINRLSGGDEDSRGWIDRSKAGSYLNNPAIWNHLLQGYFGGMYNTIAKGFDVMTTVGSGEMPNAYQIPIVNRFVNSPWERDNSGALGEDYWQLISDNDEFMHNISKKRKRAKDGDTEAQKKLDELMKSDDYKRSLVINQYKKLIKTQTDLEAETSDKEERARIKQSISFYKKGLMKEIAAIDKGKDPFENAKMEFDNSYDAEYRKAIALRIAKEAGADKDPYGKKPESDPARLYQQLRTADDVYEDAKFAAYQAQLKEQGNEELADEVSKARAELHRETQYLEEGYPDDNAAIMEDIRTERRRLMSVYGIR